jgi:hypothetical protein
MTPHFGIRVAATAFALIVIGAGEAAACEACFTNRSDLSLSIGANHDAHAEFYLRHEGPSALGAFRPVVGASVSTAAESWAGIGLMLTWKSPASPFFVQGSVMPGVYSRGRGVDLGGNFQIRSSLELGYELPSAVRLSVGFDHRSNADTNAFNPGMDGVHLRVTMPLR